MANTYDVGDVVRLSCTFTVSSVATDPTTVTLKVLDPSGTTTTLTYALVQITRDSAGVYHYDLSIDESGVWYYRWVGTGAVATAEEEYLLCRSSQF